MEMDKILVVDDETDILELSSMMLEKEGYKVLTTDNGEEAIRIAEEHLPDLVLMDVVMTGVSGIETCRAIKEKRRTAQIPVVMFTALGREVDRRLGKEAGADGHFTKPFNEEALLSLVRSKLEVSRLNRFSSSLGLRHEQLRGRKILFEYDPGTAYERCIRDLCLEAGAHCEDVAVLTYPGGAIHCTVSGDEGLDVRLYKDGPVITPILDEHDRGYLTLIYDSISDHALSSGFNIAYAYLRNVLRLVGEDRITALFLLNLDAHEPREVASFRGLFSQQVYFGEDGLERKRLS
ncbi:MAG: response regulator [Candidatus Bathyarchaeia archaeon]